MDSTSAAIRSEQEIRQTIANLINDIFDEFRVRLRNWKTFMPDQASVDAAKKAYVRLLKRYHIGDEQVIRNACERVCTDLRWYQPPDDFIEVCLDIMGERMGLPTVSEALKQAVRHQASDFARHDAVVFTLQHMASDQVAKLRSEETEKAEVRWRKYWRETIRHKAAGGEFLLLDGPNGKTEEESPSLSREANKVRLANFKAELGL